MFSVVTTSIGFPPDARALQSVLILTEIARASLQAAQPERAIVQLLCDHVRHAIAPLQRAIDHEQRSFQRLAPLSGEELRPKNDIENAALILERGEYHPRGCGRLLHMGHEPSDAHAAAIG